MRGMSTSARPRAAGFLAIFGVGVIAGSIAGPTACAAQGAEPTPAQIVNFRFPPGWNRVAAAPPAVRVAEAGDAGMPPLALFSPHPTYPLGTPQAEAGSELRWAPPGEIDPHPNLAVALVDLGLIERDREALVRDLVATGTEMRRLF